MDDHERMAKAWRYHRIAIYIHGLGTALAVDTVCHPGPAWKFWGSLYLVAMLAALPTVLRQSSMMRSRQDALDEMELGR